MPLLVKEYLEILTIIQPATTKPTKGKKSIKEERKRRGDEDQGIAFKGLGRDKRFS